MAGVNLNEESARILATNSELVGTHIRSCKDEAFLHPGLLHRRILETGTDRTLLQYVIVHDGTLTRETSTVYDDEALFTAVEQ